MLLSHLSRETQTDICILDTNLLNVRCELLIFCSNETIVYFNVCVGKLHQELLVKLIVGTRINQGQCGYQFFKDNYQIFILIYLYVYFYTYDKSNLEETRKIPKIFYTEILVQKKFLMWKYQYPYETCAFIIYLYLYQEFQIYYLELFFFL